MGAVGKIAAVDPHQAQDRIVDQVAGGERAVALAAQPRSRDLGKIRVKPGDQLVARCALAALPTREKQVLCSARCMRRPPGAKRG